MKRNVLLEMMYHYNNSDGIDIGLREGVVRLYDLIFLLESLTVINIPTGDALLDIRHKVRQDAEGNYFVGD